MPRVPCCCLASFWETERRRGRMDSATKWLRLWTRQYIGFCPRGFKSCRCPFFFCYGRKDMLDLVSQSDGCGVSTIMFRHEEWPAPRDSNEHGVAQSLPRRLRQKTNLLSKCTARSIINLTNVKTLNECCTSAIIFANSKWICFVKSKLRKSL